MVILEERWLSSINSRHVDIATVPISSVAYEEAEEEDRHPRR